MTQLLQTSQSTKSPDERLLRRPLGRYRYTRLRWRVVFALIDAIGGVFFGIARSIGSRFWDVQAPKDEPRRILLVQLDHLGDAILTTSLLRPLHRRFPTASIEVLASPWNRAIFDAAPEVDRVDILRTNRFSRTGRFGWLMSTLWCGLKLRHRKFDLAIDIRGEAPLAMLLWLSGSPRRLGWNCGGAGFFLTDSPKFVSDRSEIESRSALLAELEIHPNLDENAWVPTYHPSEVARVEIARRLDLLSKQKIDQNLVRPGGRAWPIVAMHIGAGTRAKQWGSDRWRELIGRLVHRMDAKVVLVGSAEDRIIAQRILGREPSLDVADWTGQLTIETLAALLEGADVLVGADSGPAHLAAAVGTSVVVLFSGTNRVRQWCPQGSDVRVVRHPVACSPCHREECPLDDHPCMRGISSFQVTEVVEAMCKEAGKESADDSPVARDRHSNDTSPATSPSSP